LQIAPELLEQVIAHAREEAPNECCGVIAVELGSPARAVHAHRAVNTAASPLRFEIDGREVLNLIEQIEGDGLELGAIYHSHTRTAPYPSQTDINFAAHWPGVEWLIVGLADRATPEVRSYLIDDGQVQEVAI
jgi:[CysO sulfur-carrier protein]-S-L-cysteine hydrolase